MPVHREKFTRKYEEQKLKPVLELTANILTWSFIPLHILKIIFIQCLVSGIFTRQDEELSRKRGMTLLRQRETCLFCFGTGSLWQGLPTSDPETRERPGLWAALSGLSVCHAYSAGVMK